MSEFKHPKIIFIATAQSHEGKSCFVGQAGVKDSSMINLPPNSKELVAIAEVKAKSDLQNISDWRIVHAEPATFIFDSKVELFTSTAVKRVLEMSAINPSVSKTSWYVCSPQTAIQAIVAVKQRRQRLYEHEIIPWPKLQVKPAKTVKTKKPAKGHPAADALPWKDAQKLIHGLINDARYRDAMLVGIGCYMGLRISDSLTLRWSDLLDKDRIEIIEQKTKKKRTIKINPSLSLLTAQCHDELYIDNPNEYIVKSTHNGGGTHITRQRVNQIIHEMMARYLPDRNMNASSHTFRKTFGRRIFENECEKGRGDMALILLADVFGHSNINITKRYLGIRKEEILSVYDIL